MTDLLRVPGATSVAGCNESHAALETATRRLAEAARDFDRALDRGAQMYELQQLDREVMDAERRLAAATGDHARTTCSHPDHRSVADGNSSQVAG